jgi:transcriptional regulator
MASLPVVKGTLDVLVLRALQWTPMHGFEITSWLEERSSNSLELEDSAVYQALYRMEERGLIEAEWGVTENQRQARYYKITTAGRAHLKAQIAQWVQYSQTVTAILTATPKSA